MEAWAQELRGSYVSWHISMDMSRTCEDISRHVKDMKVHSQTIPYVGVRRLAALVRAPKL